MPKPTTPDRSSTLDSLAQIDTYLQAINALALAASDEARRGGWERNARTLDELAVLAQSARGVVREATLPDGPLRACSRCGSQIGLASCVCGGCGARSREAVQ